MAKKAVSVNATGALRMLAGLQAKTMRVIERKAMRVAAKTLRAAMAKEVPVVSGRLRKSLKVRAGRRSRLKQTVLVVATAPYSLKIEEIYGYTSIAAHDAFPAIERAFRDSVDDLVREVNGG